MAITTVRGSIPTSQARYTLSHEHLLCDLWSLVRKVATASLTTNRLRSEKLADYRDAGGCSVIDATSCGLGRNPRALRRISEATGVHIVMGSGWYRECAYPPLVFERDANALADLIVEEITVGADGTHIRAGIIGEIGNRATHYISSGATGTVFLRPPGRSAERGLVHDL